ncbi:MAG: hypothetical protein ACKVP3_23100 [Hyphomicrobiaceae bacterium]
MSKNKGPDTPPSGGNPEDSSGAPTTEPTQLPALIPDELRQEMVDKLGPQKVLALEQTIMKVSLYRSDWPPPDYVADAEAALPGSGRKIVDAVATKIETQNRIAERKALGAERRMDRGQLIGAATIAMGIFAATYIATSGAPSFYTMIIAVVIVLACVGGPSVARLLADNLYLQRSKPPQPPPPAREKNRKRR